MARKGAREKSPEQSVSPPPVPTKARAKRAAAAVVDSETAHTSALELSPKKKDKKDKKEKREKKEKKEKKGKEEKEDNEDKEDKEDKDAKEEKERKDKSKKSYKDVLDDESASDDAEDEVVHETLRVIKHTVPTSGIGRLSSWRLPGALSPYVDNTAGALFEAGLFAVVSTTLSRAARYGVTWHAIASPSFMDSTGWDILLQTSLVQGYWALAAAVTSRLVKHVVGWNDVYALSALNVLIAAPMVYLLSVFYNVPLSASLLSESLDIASDLLPVLAYKKWMGSAPAGDKKTKTGPLQSVYDPALRVLLIVFSSVLYNFMVVQACRAYLPEALVLHFSGISTVEPARALPVTWSSFFSHNSVVFALFQSPSVVAISTVCAYAAWVYIFERLDNPAGTEGLAVMKPIAMRSLATSVAVGLGVFVRCFTGVYSVDATGAALYSIVWTLSPLVVGAVLGYIVSF